METKKTKKPYKDRLSSLQDRALICTAIIILVVISGFSSGFIKIPDGLKTWWAKSWIWILVIIGVIIAIYLWAKYKPGFGKWPKKWTGFSTAFAVLVSVVSVAIIFETARGLLRKSAEKNSARTQQPGRYSPDTPPSKLIKNADNYLVENQPYLMTIDDRTNTRFTPKKDGVYILTFQSVDDPSSMWVRKITISNGKVLQKETISDYRKRYNGIPRSYVGDHVVRIDKSVEVNFTEEVVR